MSATSQIPCRLDVLLESAGNVNMNATDYMVPGADTFDVDRFTLMLGPQGVTDVGWGARAPAWRVCCSRPGCPCIQLLDASPALPVRCLLRASERAPAGDLRPRNEATRSLERVVEIQVAQVSFRLHITPSEECLRSVYTDTPRNIVVGAMIFASFVIGVGLVYDSLSRSFLRSVMRDFVRTQQAKRRAELAAAEIKHRFITTGARRAARSAHVREGAELLCSTLQRAAAAEPQPLADGEATHPPAVSHEVRTPLWAVLGSAALLGETALDAEQKELVSMLEAGANNVRAVTLSHHGHDRYLLRGTLPGNGPDESSLTDLPRAPGGRCSS